MTRRVCWNHTPAFRAKVALAAVRGEKTLVAYFGESVPAFRFKPPTVSVISPTGPMGPVGGRRRDPSFSPYAGIVRRAKRHGDDEGSAAFLSAARTRRMDSPVSSMRSAR